MHKPLHGPPRDGWRKWRRYLRACVCLCVCVRVCVYVCVYVDVNVVCSCVSSPPCLCVTTVCVTTKLMPAANLAPGCPGRGGGRGGGLSRPCLCNYSQGQHSGLVTLMLSFHFLLFTPNLILTLTLFFTLILILTLILIFTLILFFTLILSHILTLILIFTLTLFFTLILILL